MCEVVKSRCPKLQEESSPKHTIRFVESRIYKLWQDGGYFKARPYAMNEDSSARKPYDSIPPPNVTGQLHMGHALDETWRTSIRFKRMQGYEALLSPAPTMPA